MDYHCYLATHGKQYSFLNRIASQGDLLQSLLYLASLPIQFDLPNNWVELEQLHRMVTSEIQYHRMKQWYQTKEYYKQQITKFHEFEQLIETRKESYLDRKNILIAIEKAKIEREKEMKKKRTRIRAPKERERGKEAKEKG